MVLLLNPGLPGLRYLPANISAFAAATGPRKTFSVPAPLSVQDVDLSSSNAPTYS